MHYPLTDIQANFEINRPVRYRNTAKRNYFHRQQTDGQTRTRTIGSTTTTTTAIAAAAPTATATATATATTTTTTTNK